MSFKTKNAFTIVELSAVLAIIGLIVAGILVGDNMLKISQSKKIINDVSAYQSAVNAFVAQYEGIPGDLSTASSYFGTSCDATPANCNGNSDGIITYNTPSTKNEALRAWQHLYLAKFIDPLMTGVGQADSVSNNKAVVNTNIPYSNIKGSGYLIAQQSDIQWNNALMIGGQATNDINNFAGISAEISYMIDNKIDDGIATTGKVKGLAGLLDNTTCASGTAYIIKNTGPSCRLFFYTNISSLMTGGSL